MLLWLIFVPENTQVDCYQGMTHGMGSCWNLAHDPKLDSQLSLSSALAVAVVANWLTNEQCMTQLSLGHHEQWRTKCQNCAEALSRNRNETNV